MDEIITIYHGSKQIVEVPVFGEGKKNNDFGLGFYCTESNDLAKEWAVSSLRDGFSNRYTLDTEYLHNLNLNRPDYTILNWIAVLVENRIFSMMFATGATSLSFPKRISCSMVCTLGYSMPFISN